MSSIAAPQTLMTNEICARVGVLSYREQGCATLVRGLEDFGFTVVHVDAESFKGEHVHLLVIAVASFSEEASEAIQEFRRMPEHTDTPVLVISSHYGETGAAGYIAAGATQFLSQPACAGDLRGWCERILHAQRKGWLFDQWIRERRRGAAFDRVVVPLGLALFAEHDYGQLLEMILLEAKAFCMADGGTLYMRTADERLEFTMVHNDTLGIAEGGPGGAATRFPPLPLYRADTGAPEFRYIATYVALTGDSVNLPDVYTVSVFDLSGTKLSDAQNGYRTKSVLAMPLTNQQGRVIGVLQLINARDPMTGEVKAFDANQEETIASLARLAGSGLESYRRMHALREQIQALRLEIDEVKKQAQVAQITGSEYFQGLKDKARLLRDRVRDNVS